MDLLGNKLLNQLFPKENCKILKLINDIYTKY